MQARGKLVILLILVIGLLAACFAVWFRHWAGHRSLALWGADVSLLIRDAPQVELLRLDTEAGAESAAIERLWLGQQNLVVAQRIDISRANGLLHVRHALVEDRSFDWSQPDSGCQPRWQYVLRFRDGGRAAAMALDFECRRVWLLDANRQTSFAPISRFLETFIRGQLQRAEAVGPR